MCNTTLSTHWQNCHKNQLFFVINYYDEIYTFDLSSYIIISVSTSKFNMAEWGSHPVIIDYTPIIWWLSIMSMISKLVLTTNPCNCKTSVYTQKSQFNLELAAIWKLNVNYLSISGSIWLGVHLLAITHSQFNFFNWSSYEFNQYHSLRMDGGNKG